MTTRNLLLTSVLTIAVVGLFTIVLGSSLLPGNANAVQVIAGHLGALGGATGHHRGWHAHACDADHREQMLAMANAWVSISLDLTDAQQAALAPVLEVTGRWHEDAGFCNHPDVTDVPTALALMDTLVERTQAAMDELVPAFTHFYGMLTPAQQARLNAWISEHHGA